MMTYRTEKDPLGEMQVPADALLWHSRRCARWRTSRSRGSGRFRLRGRGDRDQESRRAHRQTGRLEAPLADAIVRAADEVLAGRHRDQFVVDIYQAGAGTSHNMNCNEVLASRANELLGAARGAYAPVHPNDHVNMAQSTSA